jgi:RNA polymerase sigma factor (sigma-70 family)
VQLPLTARRRVRGKIPHAVVCWPDLPPAVIVRVLRPVPAQRRHAPVASAEARCENTWPAALRVGWSMRAAGDPRPNLMSASSALTSTLELTRLLRSPESTVREAAWEQLISAHTRLLMSVARSFGGGHDDAMERYCYMIEKCREADFRRLRAFDVAGGASFSTWLTVTARHLCLDHDRSRYGRHRATLESGEANARRALRRALAQAIGTDIDTDLLPDTATLSADERAILLDRQTRLQSALSSLTPRERLLLALRFDDDLSASQIAGVLVLPTPFHVYRQLNAVLARLRASLVASGFDDAQG